jgi:hypothetical protein
MIYLYHLLQGTSIIEILDDISLYSMRIKSYYLEINGQVFFIKKKLEKNLHLFILLYTID